MIEGEGSLTFIGPNKYGVRYFSIQLVNTDVEIIATLLRVTGVGRVCLGHPPGPPQGGGLGKYRKQQWRWAVQRHKDVQYLIEQVAPYCWKVRRGLGLRWYKKGEE